MIILLFSGTLDKLWAKELTDIIDIINLIVSSAVLSSIVYIYVFLADAIVPDDYKQKIVYFHCGDMPGYTIFSKMKNNVRDDRFTGEDILVKYKDIYENMPRGNAEKKKYENAKWYQIYRRYRKEPKIYESNRDYLLCRDIAIMTLVLIIICVISDCLLGGIKFTSQLYLILCLEFLISDIAMRGKARRLVYNVISEDIYNDE